MLQPGAGLPCTPWSSLGCGPTCPRSSPRCRRSPLPPARSTSARGSPTPTAPRADRGRRGDHRPAGTTSTRRASASASLRTAIAEHQRRFYGLDVDPERGAGHHRRHRGHRRGDARPRASRATRWSLSSRTTTRTRRRSRSAGASRRPSRSSRPSSASTRRAAGRRSPPRTKVRAAQQPAQPDGRRVRRRAARPDRALADASSHADRGHRRGVRAPDLRRSRAHPAGDPAGDGRAHAHDLLGRQVVLRHRVEGRLGAPARPSSSRRARGQAVPHLRQRGAVPAGLATALALPDSFYAGSHPACRASATCSPTGWRGRLRPCPDRRARTSWSPTSAPLGVADGAEFCRRLPELVGRRRRCRSRCSTTIPTPADLVRFAFCKRDEVLTEAVSRLGGLKEALA